MQVYNSNVEKYNLNANNKRNKTTVVIVAPLVIAIKAILWYLTYSYLFI